MAIPTLAWPYRLVFSRSSAVFRLRTRLMGNIVNQRCSHTAAVQWLELVAVKGKQARQASSMLQRCAAGMFEAAVEHGCLARGARQVA